MEERALFLALGVLAAVVWPGRLAAEQPRTKWGAGIVLAVGAIVLILWYAWRFSAKFGLWFPNPFLFAPVDSLLIGYLVGHIIPAGRTPENARADAAPTGQGQQPPPAAAAPTAGRQQPAAAQPSTNEAAGRGIKETADRALEWAASFLAAVRGTVTGVAVVALLVLGVVPPQTWGHFVHRLEGVKAAGVEFTLGTVVGDKAAQDISVAAPPPGPLDGAVPDDRHGFVAPRLERMINLAFPVALPEGQPPATVLAQNPTGLLFAKPDEPWSRSSVTTGGQPQVRGVQRDRAMLLHLQLSGAAVDTRQDRGIPAREGGRFGGQIEPAMLTDLQSLGGMQERVLARLADHVACVNEVITETNDRRLTEYRTARVVEELYMFARIWQSLERSHVMARLGVGHAVGDAARAAAFQELQVRANLLSQRIKEFTWWADNTIEALRAGRSERTATIGTGATPPGREPGRREPPLPHATIVVSAGGVPVLALPEGVPGQPAAR